MENRSWRTEYRGRLWIHASANSDAFLIKRYVECGADSPGGWRTSAILGCVDLVDVVPIESVHEHPLLEPIKNDPDHLWWTHIFGDYCWILANPAVLEKPIPTKGKLGLWKYSMDRNVEKLLVPRKDEFCLSCDAAAL